MPGSTYSTNLKVELMATGENSGTWGDVTNTNLGTALEQAIVGYGNPDYASDANLTISITNSNAAQAARALVLNVTSSLSLTATRELVVPTIQKQYIVQNNTTGSQSITVKTSAGTGITVPNGRKAHLYVDGTNVIQMFDFVDINGGAIDGTTIGAASASTGAFTTLNASGATTLDGNVTLGNASGDNVTVTGTITSNLLFTDNTYDIGASGATRPRNLFLAGAATIGGNLSVGGTLTLTGGVNLNGNVTVGDSSSDTLTINSTITSNLIFTDNTYDIGASGATRPRNLFLAGNATISGNQTLTGALTVDSTTDSSSTTTGSIQTDGGLGVAKSLYVGTTLNVAGAATFNGAVTLGDAAADNITVNGTVTSNLIFTDNTYDIGASGATRPRNLFLAGTATLGSTVSAARYIVNSTSNAGTSDISLGSYSSGAWLNSPSGTTGYIATGGTGVASWTSTGVTVNAGNLYVAGTGGRGVNVLGGGNGAVQIAGDGSTYAIGVTFYDNYASLVTPMTGMYVYGSGGVYQYMSLGGSAYNNGAIYIDSAKKVGILKVPSAQFDSINTVSIQNAQSTGLGYGAAITQGTGTLAMAAGSGNQRGNLMTIYGAQGSPTTTIPYGQDYDTMGLNVAMDSAAGGGYTVTGIGSYARSDGAAIAFRANAVQTNASPGTFTYGFYSESSSGANLNYGFYQSGSSTLNYFNGWVGVGVTNTPYGNTTNERMTVEGNYNGRQWLSIRNTNSGSSSIAGVVVNAYGNSWALEMGSTANNSNALNFTVDIYGTPAVKAFMATSGIMTFYGSNSNRPVRIGDGGSITIRGESGGWQIGEFHRGANETIISGFASLGNNSSLDYSLIGPDYTNTFARFNANGIGVGNTTPSTSGVGITFPATQSASSGANTLDDYEEGTWTPTDASGAGISFTVLGGFYTKVGRLVTATVEFTVASNSSSTAVSIGGFPFPTNSDVNYRTSFSNGYQNKNLSFVWYTLAGVSSMQAYQTSGAAVTYSQLSAGLLAVTFTYMTN